MVAISLYRGNLHRVSPEVPRRWLMPTPKITLKDFRSLLSRRSKALHHNNNNLIDHDDEDEDEDGDDVKPLEGVPAAAAADVAPVAVGPPLDQVEGKRESGVEVVKKEENVVAVVAPVKVEVATALVEGNDKSDAVDEEKETRRNEVEEKLKILTEKKHTLVQALKQILNAEEELTRRCNMQAGRPPLPLQVDVSNDSGSMTRHATPRTTSEPNAAADMEGGDGGSNQHPHPRQLLRMSSTSPSAESALRRAPYFQHNVVSHPSRAAMVAAGSPSRFAPSGNQTHPPNLPSVSVSGTNYVASSPSPAASGGTSVFREARQQSPWN